MSGRVHEKITPHHHKLAAYVYVRQSTLKQVHQHHEGRQNQYALVQRALDLGWPPERVRVIDADLGQSGQANQRPGFQELVAAVSLGRVGPSWRIPRASMTRASIMSGCSLDYVASSVKPSCICCVSGWMQGASARFGRAPTASISPQAWYGYLTAR
jgi:hypothetical protein